MVVKAGSITLLLALMIVTVSMVPAFAARESVQVTRLANAVTVDGKWTRADEWSDTYRVSMYLLQGPQSIAYVRLKHDAGFLYMLVDFVSDTTKAANQTSGSGDAYDGLNVGIDYVNSLKMKCCDVYVQFKWANGMSAPAQTTPSWVESAISYDATNDPDSTTAHAIYEAAFPKETLGPPNTPMAVRISVWDWSRAVNMHWPQWQGPTGGSWDTKYFGDLVFSEVAVPEFPIGAAVFFSVLLLGTFLATRRESPVKAST
jgi:hypothetical protein